MNWLKTLDRKPYILVLGHGRHGKDTFCDILRDEYGFSFVSSSLYCAERVMMPYFASQGIHYPDVESCYNDRHRDNNRQIWFDQISVYNGEDPTRTAVGMKSLGHNIYCGMRSQREYDACVNAGVFDYVVWVDASKRMPLESESSFNIEVPPTAFFVDNNGPMVDIYPQVHRFVIHMRLTFNPRKD